jgi:sugar lactone lactonase YvrE
MQTEIRKATLRAYFFAAIMVFVFTGCGGGGASSGGGAGSGGASNTPSVPSAPLGLFTTPGNAQVSLSWSPVTGATSYNLYWSTSGNAGTGGTKVAGVSSSYRHSGLTNGTTYYYVLTAVNSAGESAPSTQVSATPAATTSPGYTISGHIVGLANGQSVILQNNGGDNLTVSANGAFTFKTPLAYNAIYKVTVLTQPANGQTCAIATNYTFGGSSGSGTVSASNVDTVRLSCYSVTTFAGSGVAGLGEAIGEEAVLNGPSGAAFDTAGNLYVSDALSHVILKITPAGAVTTLAGSIQSGYTDATGAMAQFNFASPGAYSGTNANAKGMAGVAVDSSGNVYVADIGNNVIRKITPAGVVSTLAGSGVAGYVDATGTAAQFNFKTGSPAFGYTAAAGIAVDSTGNVYVGDSGNNVIRKITPAGGVSTLAGSPGVTGYVNGTGAGAQFYTPLGVAVDGSGNVYVADYGNCAIRKVTPAGVVTTFAGESSFGTGSGYLDSTGTAAQFFYPQGLTIDASGNLYVTDNSTVIRMITQAGVVSTIAGSQTIGKADGPAIAAKFSLTQGIALDGSGNVYVADRDAHKIRKASINPYGYTIGGHVVGLVSGSSLVLQNNGGNNLTVNAKGLFTFPTPLTDISGAASYNVTILTQPAGQTCTIANNTGGFTTGDVLSVDINCAAVSTLAGSGVAGYVNATGPAAQFNFRSGGFDIYAGVATDTSGNVYVADTQNCVIRKITPAGVASTFAGSTCGYLDSTTATGAQFMWPHGVAVDGAGNVYVADTNNGRIRKISTTGAVTSLAGSGAQGHADGTGAAAMFAAPMGLAVDASGNVYVADMNSDTIRKVTPAGVVTTVAGVATGASLMKYVNGLGNIAEFNSPTSVALDAAGNLYVADYNNHAIRKITPAGMVSTLAGLGGPGVGAVGYFNSTGTGAALYKPSGVAVDAAGNVFVTDTWNNVVRVINPMGTVLTLAGPTAPTTTAGLANGNGTSALFNYPDGIAVDAAGNVYVADSNNNVIRKIVQ